MHHFSNRRNRPASFNPKAMFVAELQGLPKKTLVLLASARNLITTGLKAQIAQRIFEHEHSNPRHSATIAVTANADDGSTAPLIEEPIDQPFSSGQLNQLRQLIAKAVGSCDKTAYLTNEK